MNADFGNCEIYPRTSQSIFCFIGGLHCYTIPRSCLHCGLKCSSVVLFQEDLELLQMDGPPAKRPRPDHALAPPPTLIPELHPAYSPLTEWFAHHGADSALEIEARFRTVTQAEFQEMLATLRGSPAGWSAAAREITLDVFFSEGVRQTFENGQVRG